MSTWNTMIPQSSILLISSIYIDMHMLSIILCKKILMVTITKVNYCNEILCFHIVKNIKCPILVIVWQTCMSTFVLCYMKVPWKCTTHIVIPGFTTRFTNNSNAHCTIFRYATIKQNIERFWGIRIVLKVQNYKK